MKNYLSPDFLTNNLLQEITAKERKLFREMDSSPTSNTMSANDGTGYIYFAPSWHFEKQLITPYYLNNLDKKILSIGAGGSHLERFMVHMGVNIENIILSDKNKFPAHITNNFQTISFDAHQAWPEDISNQKFDLIMLPEFCDGLYFYWNNDQDSMTRLDAIDIYFKLFDQALSVLNNGGELRFSGASVYRDLVNPYKPEPELILNKIFEKLQAKHDSIQLIDLNNEHNKFGTFVITKG